MSKASRTAKAAAATLIVSPSSTTVEQLSTGGRKWIYGSKEANDEQVLGFVHAAYTDKFIDSEIIVGTDSHVEGQNFRFVSIVCVYNVGKGGDFYRLITHEPRSNYATTGPGTEVGSRRRKHNHKLRMFNEVAKSIEICDWIRDGAFVSPIIHIDASKPGARHFTSAFSTELQGYAVASGYVALLKDESWVASHIADKYSK